MSDWSRIPTTLHLFDAKPSPRCPEAMITQLTWSCLAYMPSLPTLLGTPAGLLWYLGRRGCGDLSGFTVEGSAGVHIEIKSDRAAVNWSKTGCRQRCGEYLSQFHHMAHDEHAVILAFTHARRVPKLTAELALAGLDARVAVRSFGQLADAVDHALAADGPPKTDLLACLLDVEQAA